MGAGLLAYAPLGFLAAALGDAGVALVGALGACGLSLLPDADLYLPLGHRRGVTHTVWFAGNVGVVSAAFGGSWAAQAGSLSAVAGAIFGFLVGAGAVLTHVAADALTPPGVAPLWPLDDRGYERAFALASSPAANYVLLVTGVMATGWGLLLGTVLAS